jgi:hypothetical protein
MSNLLKKYYPASEIETGFFANPGEFVLDDGTEYVGIYCKVGGRLLTGNTPTRESKFLFSSNIQHKSERNQIYYGVTKRAFDKHVKPEYYVTVPTSQDYKNLSYIRYAAQKINEPSNIIEISKLQFGTANSRNKPGINTTLYRVIDIPWVLQGRDAAMYNDKTLQLKENVMPGIRAYFSDFSEFVK